MSCRSSATIATSVTLWRSAVARSSISAGVASRPANTPKLTRISSAGGSKVLVAKAIAGSTDPIVLRGFPLRKKLTLARRPPESADCDDRSEEAPGEERGHVSGSVPDLVTLPDDVEDELDEERQREDIRHRLQPPRVVALEERPREEEHRQVDRVDDRRRAFR